MRDVFLAESFRREVARRIVVNAIDSVLAELDRLRAENADLTCRLEAADALNRERLAKLANEQRATNRPEHDPQG